MPCRLSRQKNQSITDWGDKHKDFVTEWNRRNLLKDGEMRATNWEAYGYHMRWYDDVQKHRLRLRPGWTAEDIAELEEDDPEDDAYQTSIKDMHSEFREFAPLINRVVSLNRWFYVIYFVLHCDSLMSLQSGELNRCIFDASDALGGPRGTVQTENSMREKMKVTFQPPPAIPYVLVHLQS
jgi:hypothetical protein